MKHFSMLFAVVVVLVSMVCAQVPGVSKVEKQSDGTYLVYFPLVPWQTNPAAEKVDLQNKTTTFGKDVTVCADVFINGERQKSGNQMLVTKTDYTNWEAVGRIAPPAGANQILVWCLAPAGEAKGTKGCMLLNPKDPNYTPAGYLIKL